MSTRDDMIRWVTNTSEQVPIAEATAAMNRLDPDRMMGLCVQYLCRQIDELKAKVAELEKGAVNDGK